MRYLIILTFLLSLSANASLSALTTEYLSKGSDNESLRMGLEVNALEKSKVFESKAWQLSMSGENTKSKLERSSSLLISSAALLPNNTESTSYNLSLSKEFFTGTKVSLSNTLVNYVNNVNSTHNNKGFTQRLSLEQGLWNNFLGRNDSLNLEIAESTYDFQQQSSDYKIESNIYTFVSEYLSAKLNKANVELKQEALSRSSKRLSIIKRRVRDGLSERVDLYSAQTQELASIESLKSEIISFQTSLEGLSKKMHREVKGADILNYDLKVESEIIESTGAIEENKNFLQTKKQIEYLSSTNSKLDNSIYPSLVFGTSYSTNNFESSDSPISNGVIGSDNNEVTLGLTLRWNIGSKSEMTSKQIASIELNKARMESRKVLLSLKEQESSLIKRQKEVGELISSASKRLELSSRTLKEYNRLYSRGRATLDQVIRAEEELISTQQSYTKYLYLKDTNRSTLAFLRGKLRDAIIK